MNFSMQYVQQQHQWKLGLWNISGSHGKKHCENDLRPDRKYFILIGLSHLLPRYVSRVYCSRVFSAIALGLPCAPRRYGYDSVVCVCNATYCDSAAELPEDLLQQGYYVHYVSSRDGDRLNVTTKPLAPSGNSFPHRESSTICWTLITPVFWGSIISPDTTITFSSLNGVSITKWSTSFFYFCCRQPSN